jgi:hypothetical protein
MVPRFASCRSKHPTNDDSAVTCGAVPDGLRRLPKVSERLRHVRQQIQRRALNFRPVSRYSQVDLAAGPPHAQARRVDECGRTPALLGPRRTLLSNGGLNRSGGIMPASASTPRADASATFRSTATSDRTSIRLTTQSSHSIVRTRHVSQSTNITRFLSEAPRPPIGRRCAR